jgi:acetyltransferase-like isoleucine patch superfamily enzyme
MINIPIKKIHKTPYEWINYRKIIYWKFVSKFWYSLFFKKIGSNSYLRTPLFITPAFIELGSNVMIRDNSRIEGIYINVQQNEPYIYIGDNVNIEQNLHLTCACKVEINKNSSLASNVTITDIRHPYEDILTPPEKQPLYTEAVFIGENCKIYNNAVITHGVILNNHTIVGANSTVLKGEYPPYIVLSGTPAKIIRKYDFNQNKWIKCI